MRARLTVPRPSSLTGLVARRAQSVDDGRQRNHFRNQSEPSTGQQLSFVEPPDTSNYMAFNTKTLEHVRVPELPAERRSASDADKEREMRAKYGEFGPGERVTRSFQQLKKDELKKQQDIDGLPWEVRWRRSLIPTQEELVQDLRDKYDIWIQDPIERQEHWYLHWRDRGFKAQRDRLVWPQGYTDYLDHYDENGRRRTLPTDQRWSDTSWKHLADSKYRDRMFLIGDEERKAVHTSLQSEETLMLEADKMFMEQADVWNGIQQGVIDVDPDQAYQALSGTSDPVEVAKTKYKIQEYQTMQVLKLGKPQERDPVTGFPKSDRPPLPSGLTVEQAAAIKSKVTGVNELLEERVTAAHDAGKDAWVELGSEHLKMSARGAAEGELSPEPGLRRLAETARDKVLAAQRALELEQSEAGEPAALQHTPAPKPAHEAPRTKELSAARDRVGGEGFIQVPPRPEGADAAVFPPEMAPPHIPDLPDEPPQWYLRTAIEPGPMIERYGIVKDPIEMRPVDVRYITKPQKTKEEVLVVLDAMTQGESVFDEGKLFTQRQTPEFAAGGSKPLPLYKEAVKESSTLPATEKKSKRLAQERQARQKRIAYDPDLLLPDLPFETDSITDPYRGVVDDVELPFDKKVVEKVYTTYREFLQQRLIEFANITQTTTEDRCELLLRDCIRKVREGDVGIRPSIDPRLETVFKTSFESHFKQFLSDWLKFHSNRKGEAEALKGEADDLMRKAAAKTKQCGKPFVDFMQEMTAIEVERIKKNPVQRYTIMVREKKHEILAKPFIKWISSELGPFMKMEFASVEQMEQHREMLNRHLTEARTKAPMRVEGVQDKLRDLIVESFYFWCRGALQFYGAKHAFDLHLRYADTRFRARAEELWEESNEVFQQFYKASRECAVYIPIPHADPMYDFSDNEYLEGENGFQAEIVGDIERAERIWHTGTTMRWYPVEDETDFVHFNERRGRIQQAFDASDRCLDNLNKKTHPSIHPFPERAKKFLEGAPLSQETAEHLWLRYMADVYIEHADLHNRCGKFQTGSDYLQQAINLYTIALRTAEEKLPSTWSAPLLTKAKLLCRVLEDSTNVEKYIAEVEHCIEALYGLGETKTSHWIDRFTHFHYRVALLIYAFPAYTAHYTRLAEERARTSVTTDTMMAVLEAKGKGFGVQGYEAIEAALDVESAKWRAKILKMRERESEGSDGWHLLTHYCFLFRVRPKTPEEVEQFKKMYWSTYDYFYTQTALGSRSRGRIFHDVIRKLCQILSPGSKEQREALLKELENINTKMRHATNGGELDRTIQALELNLKDPTKVPYIYGSATYLQRAREQRQRMDNPLLKVDSSRSVYDRLRMEQRRIRAAGDGNAPPRPSEEETTLNTSPRQADDIQPAPSGRDHLERR